MTDWAWLRSEITAAATGFASDLRTLDGATKVPALEWNVHQLAAHVASFPDTYRHLAAQTAPLPGSAEFDDFSLDAMSDRLERSLDVLADEIESEFAAWLAESGDDGSAPRTSLALHIVYDTGAAALSELLVHRDDLAPLTGVAVTITPDHARTILDTVVAMSYAFVDPEVAASCTGIFHIGIRGGSDWTIEVAEGAATVTCGRPARADVRTSNEPVSMLLTSLGRRPVWKAALTGKAVIWGENHGCTPVCQPVRRALNGASASPAEPRRSTSAA